MKKIFTLFAALMMATGMWALTQEGGYYLIGSAQDLKDFAALVNGGSNTINGKLTANIDLQGGASNQWTPIGNSSHPYNGIFDGQGYTISNLYYYQAVHNVGLFGYAGSSARIKNVRAVVNIDNSGNGATTSGGGTSAGGILGMGVEGTLIINCSVAGSVISFSNVGGIVGIGQVTIVNCYNEATVKFFNNNGQVGCGIHGYGGTPTLINCYNVGQVINTGASATSHMGNIAVFAKATNCYSLENCCQNGAGAAWSNQAANGIPGTTMTSAAMQNISFTNTLYANALALWSTYQDIDTWMQDPTTGRPILNLSYRATEGPWTRIGENSGCCSSSVCTSISWNGLNNTQWNGTVIPFKDNTNGIGTIMQGTANTWQNQIIFTLYETTQTVPSYSKMVWSWSFLMKGHYEGLAQQTGLYAHTDISTLQNTALDFTYQNETNAGHEICVGLFYHNAGYLGQDVTQDHNHNFEFDNQNESTDQSQRVYMIQTHFAANSSPNNAVFGPGWVSFKDVSSTYSYYYYKHITFNANGGSGSMAQQQIENAANLSTNTFTRAGYIFTSWNTYPDGSGTAYANEGVVYANAYDKGPVTLYAQWTPITYTSAMQAGTEDASNWSMTSNPAQVGTTENVTYSGSKRVSSIATQLTTTTWTMEYTGTIQTFTAPATGTYELQVWGAQGGTLIAAGGLGGYATCRTNLTAGETIYIYVGGKGGDGLNAAGGYGGWNGGGHGGSAYTGFSGSGGGGGATHISKVNNQVIGSGSGQCASLVGTNYIIVAGGGGGGSHGWTTPGAGGGTDGGKGTRCQGTNDSQITYSANFYYSTSQSYGANGGNGAAFDWGCEGAGGGGGGYYGGTANYANGTFDVNQQDAGGCGGNSAYNSALASNFSTTAGLREGHGRAQIRLVNITGTLTPATPTKVADNHWQYTMPSNNVEVVVEYHPWEGTGTEADPYLISSTDDWNLLKDKVAAGKNYAGVYFRQTADISVTTMVGTNSYRFRGTYDGDGHTLTVSYNTTADYTGPFRYINGATIKNLHTAGTINVTKKFAGGFVGAANGANTFYNCRSSVTINSNREGDGSNGGFIGNLQGSNTTSFEGCVFDGRFISSNTSRWGGYIGWSENGNGARLSLVNCLFAPQEVAADLTNSQTITRADYSKDIFTTLTNTYYTKPLPGLQAAQADTISAGAGVTVAIAGPSIYYNVSGITGYEAGVSYGGVLIGGEDDAISLNLTHADAPVGYSFGYYSADNGTITGSANPYTLTMADANAVISANWSVNQYTISFDSNGGSDVDPITQDYGSAITPPASPTRTGYTFAGWVPAVPATMPAENITLTALWDVNASITLSDNDASMQSILTALNDGEPRNITIERSLSRDGNYSTICLPFDLDAAAIAGSSLNGFVVCELTDMWSVGDELRLLMTQRSAITAGKPYLVRYAGEPTTPISPLEFPGVTVTASVGGSTAANGATMYGILEPTHLAVGNQNYLFLMAGNTLTWPNVDNAMKAFRAYFILGDYTPSGAPIRRGMPARIIEQSETTTGGEAVSDQLSAVSCQKMLRDGQLIIIHNGVEYNANGLIIK